jgi:putative selenium metabolism protein SsnA
MPEPLLIENGTVFTGGASPAVLEAHSVFIENGRVSRIAPRIRNRAAKRLDARRKLVMPGLINAHTHLYSAFARGLTKAQRAADFSSVLRNLWWRLDSALSLEDVYYSALAGLLDSVRHGTTTLIDHHASPGAVRGSLAAIRKAVTEVGLRACLCYEVSDRDGPGVSQAGLEENAEFIRDCRDCANGRMAALFGLHASFTLHDATLEKASALGRELKTGFHIHVAEAPSDQAITRKRTGMRVVERLHKAGILGPRTIAAHCVHVNPREIGLLAETRTVAVHNPQSNLNNAVGIADLPGMMRKGVRVGLGTDAMTANLLEEVRVGVWSQHLARQDASSGFAEVTAALFQGNPGLARAIFDLPLGELREGCPADLAVFDYDPPTPLAAGNILGHLVFGVSQAAADTTIVGGRVLMENKRLVLDLDEARVCARSRELAAKLWQRF